MAGCLSPVLQSSVAAQTLLNPNHLSEMPEAPNLLGHTSNKLETEIIAASHIASSATNTSPFLVKTSTALPHPSNSEILAEIYFDWKRRVLRKDAGQIVEETATLLQKDGTKQLHAEAVCDERGTEAYTLTLGRKRTASIAAYLQSLGTPLQYISQISYGTRPHCKTQSQACGQERQRLRKIFRLLSMSSAQAGCLVQLRLQNTQTTQTVSDYSIRKPFLQRIHLAETR